MISYAAVSETGLVRDSNQDDYRVLEQEQVVVVADGVGGQKGGDIASRLAVEEVARLLQHQYESWPHNPSDAEMLEILRGVVGAANQRIRQEAIKRREYAQMGTTLVVSMIVGDKIFFAHVGDSRLYRFRDANLMLLTTDHSLQQQLVDNGAFADIQEASRAGISRNILARGLGMGDYAEADVACEQIRPGDLFLCCTDGLNGMVDDRQIESLMQQSRDNLEQASKALLVEALSAGGNDNITLVLQERQALPLQDPKA